ncbi:MAG TPA: hypothetical protein VGE34_03480 [Candidatus Saccharimonadales bacterium]
MARRILGHVPKSFHPDQIVATHQGGLNNTFILDVPVGNDSKKVAVRTPKKEADRSATERKIAEEYRQIGATALGIDFRLRHLDEQKKIMDRASKIGLKVLECQLLLGKEMVTDYMDGTPLSDYLQRDTSDIQPQMLNDILSHLTQAHSVGIVFGDRWAANTMILEDGTHKEFDFDIELQGDVNATSTFELAQTLYHIVHFANQNRDHVISLIKDLYSQSPTLLAGYDKKIFFTLLEGHRRYFHEEYAKSGVPYEGIVPPNNEISQLLALLDDIWQEVSLDAITNQMPAIQVAEA